MSVLLSLIAQTGFDGDHMGGGWAWLAIVAIAVTIGAVAWMMWGAGSNGGGSSGGPVEVLKTRYARGELSTEEFKERLRTVEDARR